MDGGQDDAAADRWRQQKNPNVEDTGHKTVDNTSIRCQLTFLHRNTDSSVAVQEVATVAPVALLPDMLTLPNAA